MKLCFHPCIYFRLRFHPLKTISKYTKKKNEKKKKMKSTKSIVHKRKKKKHNTPQLLEDFSI